jgi:hypothetical protein
VGSLKTTREKEAARAGFLAMFFPRQAMIEYLPISCKGRRFAASAVLAMVLFAAPPSHAQGTTPIRIDASSAVLLSRMRRATTEVRPSRHPEAVIGVNSRYLTLNGKPWLPVMGEFHFSRYPESQWEEEILKMKAAGVNIVATYVIWIHHEEIEGQFDWKGQRDLRAFAPSFAPNTECICWRASGPGIMAK